MSMPDLLNSRPNDSLREIKEESEDVSSSETDPFEKEKEETASVLSTSSRSMRFRVPSLRRRLTDSKMSDNLSVGGSPRSVSMSVYSAGVRSRRTSEVQSEEDSASLGLQTGLEISKDRGDSSWGVGDEVVMGLE